MATWGKMWVFLWFQFAKKSSLFEGLQHISFKIYLQENWKSTKEKSFGIGGPPFKYLECFLKSPNKVSFFYITYRCYQISIIYVRLFFIVILINKPALFMRWPPGWIRSWSLWHPWLKVSFYLLCGIDYRCNQCSRSVIRGRQWWRTTKDLVLNPGPNVGHFSITFLAHLHKIPCNQGGLFGSDYSCNQYDQHLW